MDYAASYLQKQTDSLDKWKSFIADLPKQFEPLEYREDFPQPKSLFAQWRWSQNEVELFFTLFSQFNCEALVVFEQSLIYAFRKTKPDFPSKIEALAFRHFVREEFYHTKAFRRYLHLEKKMQFPQSSLVLHSCHRLKNAFAWVLCREPLAIIIPGAKSETYSLFYSKLLDKVFATSPNSFRKLNSLHSLDEVHHVGFDYLYIDSIFSKTSLGSKVRFVFYTLINIFLIQFIVLLGMNNLLKKVRPTDSTLQRFKNMFMIFKWTLWNFPPYQQTRRSLRSTYSQKKMWIYKVFKLVAS